MEITKHYSDLDFSFQRNIITDDVSKKKDGNAIKQSIKNLLLMHRYDCPFHPDVGSQIYAALFEPMTPLTKSYLKRLITYTLQNFEPRISLNSVDVDDDPNHNRINITLRYMILNVGTEQQFTFSVYRTR